jgi:hypothetical protein
MDSPGIEPKPLLSEGDEESLEQLCIFNDTVVFLSIVQLHFIFEISYTVVVC